MRKIQLAVTAGLTAFVLATAPVATAQPTDPSETPTTSPVEETPTLTPTAEENPASDVEEALTPDSEETSAPVNPEIPTPTAEEIAAVEAEGIKILEPEEIAALADTPVEVRLQGMMDAHYGQAADGVRTPAADREAEALLAQALAGELTYQGSQPEVNGLAPVEHEGFLGFVQRGPKAEADYIFALLDAYGADPSGMLGTYLGPDYGYAYGSVAFADEEYVYYAFALLK